MDDGLPFPMMENTAEQESSRITELLPKNGLVYSEKSNLSEVLCKPKLMPIKSLMLQKLEQLEEQLLAEKKPDRELK
eukprot:g11526.t1